MTTLDEAVSAAHAGRDLFVAGDEAELHLGELEFLEHAG